MLASTVIDFGCSRGIANSQDSRVRRRLLWTSVAANLTVLGFFKYYNFFADSLLDIASHAGLELTPMTLNIVLPVGISFYTFQTMSYTIDVYRGDLKRLSSFTDFALYVAFFPQLVAGPIERGSRLAPQIESGPRTSWAGMQDGAWLIIKGLFKKAVLADNLAPIVDSTFAMSDPSAVQVLIGVYAFAFQIYGDFSGYTDIARGVGRMMGYNLMLNFRLPYFATNPSDFWQRWHISLSSWLRDYLYIPLGGNRGGKWFTYRNLVLTMLLGGLWHGAAWTFVIWGLFHGALLIAHRQVASWQRESGWNVSVPYLVKLVVMFHLTCIGWLIFRAESTTQILEMLSGLARFDFGLSLADQMNAWKLALLCVPVILIQACQESTGNLNFVRHLSLLPRTVAYASVIAALLSLGQFGQSEFIYFQF
ncbi:D-alanyl-lipoteichoic acid acyltransferase DltB (MBOAT superfamily) [Rhodopirellula rubra]|uniref:D-alanyl-lipoteichoic acid acyltransferase DltB (MBOAT superfamily) n=1 Tax=Aporhodopirellula rubra TaxID=980271 RepID=A0A7W5DXD5_9BACT|nr:MBOAT family protein [Aporhodopirellula rubra]MBB3206283.1 D-alanyl-lipoteichoic acid acyltransferase DltB (MBOAT superfamily) [Aporhodopirellula rubra]